MTQNRFCPDVSTVTQKVMTGEAEPSSPPSVSLGYRDNFGFRRVQLRYVLCARSLQEVPVRVTRNLKIMHENVRHRAVRLDTMAMFLTPWIGPYLMLT